MRFLVVGDLHAQINNLEDTEIILKEIHALSKNPEFGVEHTVFMGDLFHTHSVVRQEVIALLKKHLPFCKGSQQQKPVVLVGNHDLVGPTNTMFNALTLTLQDTVRVIDRPTQIMRGILAVPFTPDNDEFVARCNEDDFKSTNVLMCHQTFDGSQYESGFYAPSGVDPKLIRQRYVIGGHIHKKQQVGKVFLVGTPRALISSEFNENKGVHIMDYDHERGELKLVEFIRFNHLVKSYYRIDEEEGSKMPVVNWGFLADYKQKDDVSIHVHGSKEYCRVKEAELDVSKYKAKIRVVSDIKQTEQKHLSIESAGMTVEDGLKRYVFEIASVNPEIKEEVWKTIQNAMR